jgi:hypothetical protein
MTEHQQPPEVIWLQYYGDSAYWDDQNVPQRDEETTWADERVHDSDVRYIRADVAEEQMKAADRCAREECACIAQKWNGVIGSGDYVAGRIREQILESMK